MFPSTSGNADIRRSNVASMKSLKNQDHLVSVFKGTFFRSLKNERFKTLKHSTSRQKKQTVKLAASASVRSHKEK